MRAFLQIVRLELLAALRSKAVAILALGSVAWMFALPRIAAGDGTADGLYQLQVRYSIGVVFAVVLVSLSAAAAGTLAKDREAKRLQLTMVRPVGYAVVALGRMAALTAVGAAVLAVSCAILAFQVGGGRTCDHVLRPRLEPPEAAARRMFDESMAKYPDFKAKVAEIGEKDVLRYLLQVVNDTYQTVGEGESASWDFAAVDPAATPVSARIRITDVFGRLEKAVGVFAYGGFEGAMDHLNKSLVKVPLATPAADPAAAKPGVLEFRNNGEMGVSIYPRRDLALLVRADSFAWNALRAWLVLTAIVAVAVAMGVFLGASLGRGVAVFCVMAILAASVVSPAALEEYPDPLAATRADRLSLRLTDFSAWITSPLNAYTPVSWLEADECVERRDVARASFAGFAAYPLVLALLAGFAMSRKID